MNEQMKFEKYKDPITLSNKIQRFVWHLFSVFFYKPFIGRIFNSWRIFLLKCFGAKIGRGCIIYASAEIPAPWNLQMGDISCIGPKVKFHIDKIIIGSKVTISQGSYLCGGSHDISKLGVPFISDVIIVNDYAWIAAECFISKGVIIGEGAVVGARAAVFKNVDPWTVVGGNPAIFLKQRIIKE